MKLFFNNLKNNSLAIDANELIVYEYDIYVKNEMIVNKELAQYTKRFY